MLLWDKATLPSTSAATDNPGGPSHFPALDGLRGIAILLILYDHLFWSDPHSGNRFFDFLSQIRTSSWIGVNLFFALSGFLITGILFNTLHCRNYFKVFYARRVLRISPLYYGFLFLLLALTRPLHFQWNGWQYYHLTYTSNLALWRYGVPLVLPHFNINHFWSLDVEEQFYFVWPFIVYRVKNAARLITISLCGCGAVFLIRVVLVLFRDHFQNPYLVYSPTFSCADNLLFGCALALILRTGRRQQILRLAPGIFAFCAAITLSLFFLYHGLLLETNPVVPTLGVSAIGMMAASMIAMALREKSLTQRVLSNSVLRFFGRYSYGLYVYHYSLYEGLTPRLRPWFAGHFHSKAVGVIGGALTIAAISILVAFASYHLFEVRFLKMKRYFPYTSAPTPVLSDSAVMSN